MAQNLVRVQLLAGLLIGSSFRTKGSQLDMEEGRAKYLAARNPPKIKILGPGSAPEVFDELPVDTAETVTEVVTEKKNNKPAATPLSEIGLGGKTAKLLTDAGYDTVEKLRAAVDSGTDLAAEIKGLGKVSISSVIAALA